MQHENTRKVTVTIYVQTYIIRTEHTVTIIYEQMTAGTMITNSRKQNITLIDDSVTVTRYDT